MAAVALWLATCAAAATGGTLDLAVTRGRVVLPSVGGQEGL